MLSNATAVQNELRAFFELIFYQWDVLDLPFT